jgi:uncharacterized repeat protein (TIGR03803 family)
VCTVPEGHAIEGKWTKTVLYNFAGGTDGALPSGGVISDEAGNLYGTTSFGGEHIWGTVFQLTPNPDGTWTNKILYSFTGGADGRGPSGGVVRDRAGNLYGTTLFGGNNEKRTVFQLSPNADGSWKFRSLYQFCSTSGCPDGDFQRQLSWMPMASSTVRHRWVELLDLVSRKTAAALYTGSRTAQGEHGRFSCFTDSVLRPNVLMVCAQAVGSFSTTLVLFTAQL